MNEWRRVPEIFFSEILGAQEVDPFQIETMHAVRDYPQVDVKCGNEVGKTWVFAGIAVWFLTVYGPNASVIVTSSTDRQLWHQFWPEVRSFYYNAPIRLPGRVMESKRWEVSKEEKWFMLGFATSNEANFEGWHNVNQLLIMDEAKGIPDPVWKSGRRLLRGKGGVKKWLVGGTPPRAPIGEFCEISLDPKKAARWHHIHCTGWNSPRVSNVECQKDLDLHRADSPFYLSMVMGQIPTKVAGMLVSMEDVQRACDREIRPGKRDEVRLSCDVAREGTDETAIGLRQGLHIEKFIHEGKDRTTWSTARLKELARRFESPKEIPMFIDDTGVGGGVTDQLIADDYFAVPFKFGKRAHDPTRYYDAGTEMFADFGKILETEEVDLPNDPVLKAQLWSRTKVFYKQKGKHGAVTKLLSKEELKKHPEFRGKKFDQADAVGMLFAQFPPYEEDETDVDLMGTEDLIREVKAK